MKFKKKQINLITILCLIIVALACLTACNKAAELVVGEANNIHYNGELLTWEKGNADYSMISIDGGEEFRVNSSYYSLETPPVSFEVTITLVLEEMRGKSVSKSFHELAMIETLYKSNDGTVTWDAVANATAYSVSINGKTEIVVEAAYEKLLEGNHRIKVKPIVDGNDEYWSRYSEENNLTIYSVPLNVKYDGASLTWAGNAADYDVTINGKTERVKGNSLAFNSQKKDFGLQIKAIGNHISTFDSKMVSEDFHYLDAVTEIFVEDGIVKWNAIDNSQGYRIKIGGIVQKTALDETSYGSLAAGKSQDIAIMPYNESGNYFSSWSTEKTVYILDTPVASWNNDLELDGEANNNLTWNAVNAASGYTARLIKNGGAPEITTYSDVQRAFSHAYENVGIYTIEIKANASSSSADYFDSKYSAPFTIERLAAPKAVTDSFIVSNRDNLANGFTVNFIKVNGASGYQLYKDGAPLSGKYTTASALSDNNVADASNILQQEYTYMVQSMGGVKTVSGRQYITLPCLTDEALSFNIIVQATPQNLLMSGYTLSWDAVAGNNGYNVGYAGTTTAAQTPQYDLSTIKAGSYSVTVASRGNGGATLASNRSEPVSLQRLESPTNIRISAEGGGTLKYNDVSNATGYVAYLDLSSTPLDSEVFGNMYQFIETNGTTLSMVAVANYYNDLGTLYYMTSEISPTQQFIRLAAPAFPEGALANSIELLWNAPSNINTAEYTPTYRVYSAIDEQIGGGDQNGTKFNIEYLVGGSQNNFYVKAIGNDTKYLDSEYSVVITAHKIATPQFTIEEGKYVWDSVANASSYYLEINGVKASDEFNVSGSKYYYTPRFTTEGNHIVKLKAIGDGRNNLDSAAYIHTQKANILLAPTISYRYSSDTFVTNGSIIVDITTVSINSNGYQYEIAGQSFTSTNLTYSKVIQSPGKYSIRVKALGGSFDSNDVYYIDSQYAGGSVLDTITLLAPPSTSSFSINSDGTIKWAAISDSFGYEYCVAYNVEEFGSVEQIGFNVLTINNYRQYSSISIKLRAKGDISNSKTITSAWVEWTWTNSNPL